ncbi:MAG: hypothetical protein QXI93_04315 [Candidatus Methanomethylicia archaeon]
MKVKFESRIAGVFFRSPIIVSTIFRGKIRLDGVMINFYCDDPFIDALRILRGSKFFDEIGFFVFEGFPSVDLDYAYNLLGKPIIIFDGADFRFVGLGFEDFRSFMDVACVNGVVEALRVSRMVALKLLGTISNYLS